LRVCGISKEMDHELPRGLLLAFLIKNVWNQEGNGPGPPHSTSAHIPYWKCM